MERSNSSSSRKGESRRDSPFFVFLGNSGKARIPMDAI
jgi:hypothetical protein